MAARIVDIEQAKAQGVLTGASCVFGVFDGFHLGHRFLIDRTLETSGVDAEPVVVTFDVDPDEIFCKGRIRKLMSNKERIDALAASGVGAVVVLPFTSELAQIGPIEFLDSVFGEGVPRYMHVGADIKFGAKASGSVKDMREWGSAHGMDVFAHDLLRVDGSPVSATRIRDLIDCGNTKEADRLLGRKASS